jgi:hypothetical protein
MHLDVPQTLFVRVRGDPMMISIKQVLTGTRGSEMIARLVSERKNKALTESLSHRLWIVLL